MDRLPAQKLFEEESSNEEIKFLYRHIKSKPRLTDYNFSKADKQASKAFREIVVEKYYKFGHLEEQVIFIRHSLDLRIMELQ